MRYLVTLFLGSTIVIVFSLRCIAAGFDIEPLVTFGSVASLSMDSQNIYEADPRHLWEQAISAKGGRERLYQISNMAVSGEAYYRTLNGKRNQLKREELYIFPNKYWILADYGSDIFGVDMHMYNYDIGMQYVGTPGAPETRLEPIADRTKVQWLDNAPILTLLETRSLKPQPMRTRSALIDGRQVDVVETNLNGRQIDFAFDRESHLAVEITFHSLINSQNSVHSVRLSNYHKVDGITVPGKVTLPGEKGNGESLTILFNVDYNKEIFVSPPTSKRPNPEISRRRE